VSNPASGQALLHFPADGGGVGALMRAHDWSTSPLGPPEGWPQSLRSVVGLLLASKFPMFVAWGPELGFLYNDSYALILGEKHPRALGRRFSDIWSDIWEDIRPLVDRALAGEATFHQDLPLTMLRNGYEEQTWFTFSYSPVRDESGTVAGMFCACTETTGTVLAEWRQNFLLALGDRQRELRDPLAITAAAAEMLGRRLNVAQVGYTDIDDSGEWLTVGRDWSDGRIPSVVGRHRLADFGPSIAAALRSGAPLVVPDVRTDARTREPSAAAAFAALSIRAVLAVPLVKQGRLAATLFLHHSEPRNWTAAEIALAADVAERTWAENERARAEAALRESEARFRHMADNAPVMVWVTDPDGRCTYLSRSWYAFTGQTPETALGHGWLDAVHPDDQAAAERRFHEATATRAPFRMEYRLRRHDGEWHWAIDAAAPRFADGGAFLGFVGSVIDITLRKRAEEALEQAKEAAERANLAKSRFLAAASHDLRQPMQSLLLFLEILKPHVAPKGQDALKHLGRGLDALRDLLDSLLDISRLDAGIVQPAVETFAVGDLIEQIASASAPVAAAKGLELHMTPCPAAVRSDPTLLGRMLRNLVENALRYTDAGRITIKCREHAGRLRIEVHDTGIGIPPDHLERIWEEFHQVGNPERDRNRGLGLGLAIVQRLSVLLDHPVDVRSAPGRGSVFAIEVPLGRDAPQLAAVPAGEAAGNGRFAVLVDDDAIVLLALKATFESWGYAVLAAGSADQALAGLRMAGRRPDVVVADYRLREGRSGTEAILRVRETFGTDIPGIVLTGETGGEVHQDATEHRFEVIHKPVTPRQLAGALERLTPNRGGP